MSNLDHLASLLADFDSRTERRRSAEDIAYARGVEACIAVVKRRHSNDWSANATLAELEALRKAPDVAQNGEEP